MDFLPSKAKQFLRLENLIYRITESICPEYHGGFWIFYELSNGGWYMAPQLPESVKLKVEVQTNGF
jgi:hypothetical protein